LTPYPAFPTLRSAIGYCHKSEVQEECALAYRGHVQNADSNAPDSGAYYKYYYCWVSVEGNRVDFEACQILLDGKDGGFLDHFRLEKP